MMAESITVFLVGSFAFLLFAILVIYWALSSDISALEQKALESQTVSASLSAKTDFFSQQNQANIEKVKILEMQIEDFQKQEFETRINALSGFDSLKADILVLKTRVGDNSAGFGSGGGFTINQYQYVDSNRGN